MSVLFSTSFLKTAQKIKLLKLFLHTKRVSCLHAASPTHCGSSRCLKRSYVSLNNWIKYCSSFWCQHGAVQTVHFKSRSSKSFNAGCYWKVIHFWVIIEVVTPSHHLVVDYFPRTEWPSVVILHLVIRQLLYSV